MSWFSGLNRRDRQMMTAALVCAAAFILIVAFFGPSPDEQSKVPSSYSNGAHGARAAFLLLQRSGYHVERSTEPLASVARSATANTTVILADPSFDQVGSGKQAVEELLARGSRVLATGYSGAMVLPDDHESGPSRLRTHPCTATPTGLSAAAGSGEIRILPEGAWQETVPRQEAVYRCGPDIVVVTYPSAKGQVVWWASATPLENGSIADAGNLALLLNSIGPKDTTRVIWDESLHGEAPSPWAYTAGTVLPFLWWQFGLAGALLLLSFSRRSGPLRPDPVVSRAAPLEFTRALGSLYHKAGATNLCVSVAYRGFRLALERSAGVRSNAPIQQVLESLSRHSGSESPEWKAELQAASEAADGAPVTEKQALHLVQALQAAEHSLR